MGDPRLLAEAGKTKDNTNKKPRNASGQSLPGSGSSEHLVDQEAQSGGLSGEIAVVSDEPIAAGQQTAPKERDNFKSPWETMAGQVIAATVGHAPQSAGPREEVPDKARPQNVNLMTAWRKNTGSVPFQFNLPESLQDRFLAVLEDESNMLGLPRNKRMKRTDILKDFIVALVEDPTFAEWFFAEKVPGIHELPEAEGEGR